jgi:hypothetical protein
VTNPARPGTSAVVAVLGAVALLLVLVTWTASIGPDGVASTSHARPAGSARSSPSGAVTHGRLGREEVDQSSTGGPSDLMAAVGVALVGVSVVGLFVVAAWSLTKVRLRWRSRRGAVELAKCTTPTVDPDVATLVAEAMAAEAEEQRDLLAHDTEPRNAIVECWYRFEGQANRSGLERLAWQTTAEYVAGVLDLVRADRDAVAGLADLYREARFSDHPITEVHRLAALVDLDAIQRSLRTLTRTS